MSTLDGRLSLPMVMGAYQAEQFAQVKYYAELVHRKDGTWFLMAVVETDALPPLGSPTTSSASIWGSRPLATDSDGQQHSGGDVEQVAHQEPDA